MEPPLPKLELINILLVTNSVEEAFFLLSKIEKECNPAAGTEASSGSTKFCGVKIADIDG